MKNEFDLIRNNGNFNLDLINYIENEIIPLYKKNDKGHDISHVLYVLNRSIRFAKTIEDIDINMVIAIAAYHDCGHHINPKEHEAISGQILFNDKNLRNFFSEDKILIMKEAVEDHRASLAYEPRSIYGKIVSSADRLIDVDVELERTYEYRINILKEKGLQFVLDQSRDYLLSKYVGKNAKTKMFFDDREYFEHINELKNIICDQEKFVKRYIKVNNIEHLYYSENKDAIIDDNYMKWLEKFSSENGKIYADDVMYNYSKLSLTDMKNVASLERLFELVESYIQIKGIEDYRVVEAFKSYRLKFNNVGYEISNACDSIFCSRINVVSDDDFIDFNDIIYFMNSQKAKDVNNMLELLGKEIEKLLNCGVSTSAINTTVKKKLRKIKVNS